MSIKDIFDLAFKFCIIANCFLFIQNFKIHSETEKYLFDLLKTQIDLISNLNERIKLLEDKNKKNKKNKIEE